MVVRNLHKVHELLSMLAQLTEEIRTLRLVLMGQKNFPSRCTWERHWKAIPDALPAQIGCAGRNPVNLIQPWSTSGRAVAINRTVLRARGGMRHQNHRKL